MNTAKFIIKKTLISLLSFSLVGCSVQIEEETASAISNSESSISTVLTETTAISSDNTIIESEKIEFADFSHEIEYRISEHYKLNWNDDELTRLLDNAADIYINYFELFYRPYFNDCGNMYDEQGIMYTQSGISYNSFIEYIKTIFTDEYAEYLITSDVSPYANINGELCYASVGRGSNDIYDNFEFSIYEQSSEKIVIVGTGYQYKSDSPTDYNIQEYYYTVVKTADGWRFDNFELWY